MLTAENKIRGGAGFSPLKQNLTRSIFKSRANRRQTCVIPGQVGPVDLGIDAWHLFYGSGEIHGMFHTGTAD